MIIHAVGLSILVSLLFTEIVGLYSGGLITAGYVALFLTQPFRLMVTLAAALATYGAVRLLSGRIILYGRRRFAAAVLIGYMAGTALQFFPLQIVALDQDARLIGYIIPGLIANDMLRQGVVKTMVCLAALGSLVRLILLLLF